MAEKAAGSGRLKVTGAVEEKKDEPNKDGNKEDKKEEKKEDKKEEKKDDKNEEKKEEKAAKDDGGIYLKEGAGTVKDLVKRIETLGAKGVLKEFYQLKILTGKLDGRTEETFKANMKKNRYKDVGCWKQTRVKGKAPGDYIHANWVEGLQYPAKYILTQGPMSGVQGYDDTTSEFWSMVWDHGVCIIIMLCQTVEQGKSKCAEYWPAHKGAAQIYGNFSVFCKESGDRHIADHTIHLTNLILTPINGRKGRREVCHYLHSNWPDRKCPPSAAPIVDFLVRIRQAHSVLSAKEKLEPRKSPTLVHCSAGIGRTGTLVTVDLALDLLDRPNPTIDIQHIVLQLRRQRRFAVQTPVQYLCIYQAILEYLVREKRIPGFNIARFNKEVTALA